MRTSTVLHEKKVKLKFHIRIFTPIPHRYNLYNEYFSENKLAPLNQYNYLLIFIYRPLKENKKRRAPLLSVFMHSRNVEWKC
jgi:hypothetical protein